MRAALIYNNGRLAGSIKEVSPSEYVFTYDGDYFKDEHAPAISLTLPKSRQEFTSPSLFPFFANMLLLMATDITFFHMFYIQTERMKLKVNKMVNWHII